MRISVVSALVSNIFCKFVISLITWLWILLALLFNSSLVAKSVMFGISDLSALISNVVCKSITSEIECVCILEA